MSYLDTAWTGAKASYVADLGRYGKVGYSELAMHTQIAGKEVVRFALWPAEDGVHVGWAHVETEDGRITDGLPSEVLPGSVRSKLGYGNEMMPREARKKNPWYHGLSRDGMREVFWSSSKAPAVVNQANRYSSVTGPYRGQLETMIEATEIAEAVEPVQPMQVMSQQGIGAFRIKRSPGWPPPGEPTWPPRQANPRLQNKMRYPITLLIVDVLDGKPVLGQSYGPSTLPEGIREMKQNALLLAITNGRRYSVIKVLDRDIRNLPQGTTIPGNILAALTIYSVKRDAREPNPWYHGWSHDEVPEVFHAKSDREAFYGGAKRYNQLAQMRGPFRTQKQAELDCGRFSTPFYQVMGGKGRIIKAPARPGSRIVETTQGLRRREHWGLCNADAAWPHTGSADEIVTRHHNPSRRLSVPENVQKDPKFQMELAAYRKRHGMEPVEVRRVKVPDGYPKYMSAWGKAPKVFYDSSNRSSNKGKRVHDFGEGGHDKPWLVSSEERGPKFLAYVGGDFDAGGEWIEK
jgi:hypothetical protein